MSEVTRDEFNQLRDRVAYLEGVQAERARKRTTGPPVFPSRLDWVTERFDRIDAALADIMSHFGIKP
jgi:transcriptional regulator of met regulon